MKKIIIAIAILLVMGGCNKAFLEVDPTNGTLQDAQYFNTLAECESSTIVAYRNVDNVDWWELQWFRMVSGECASDNMWIGLSGGQESARQVAHYQLNAENDRVEAHWIMSYKSIFQYNSTIAGIERAPISENDKSRLISELKFLRAFHYFELVRNWGDVPYLTDILSPAEATYSRAPKSEIYANMIVDLQAAIRVLPVKSAYSAKDKGRVSKGAAQALLAKIYLYNEQWSEAEATAQQLIASNEYQLEPMFGDVHRTDNYNGPESIFEIQYSFTPTYPNLGNRFVQTALALTESGWGYFNPTSNLEQAFVQAGDTIRQQWTIIKHGQPVAGDPAVPIFNANTARSKSGRFSRKWYVPRALRTANMDRQNKNNIYLRFGDLLLVHAEAAAMQSKPTEALRSLKSVRDRVSLTTNQSLTGWELINTVRLERRLETALEGERLYDLRRWKEQDGSPTINKIFGPQGSFVLYNAQISTDAVEKTNTFEAQSKGQDFVAGKHNLWPIPTKEIIAAEGRMEQNTGY